MACCVNGENVFGRFPINSSVLPYACLYFVPGFCYSADMTRLMIGVTFWHNLEIEPCASYPPSPIPYWFCLFC